MPSGNNQVEKTFTVRNEKGLHARPASDLVKKALTFEADVKLEKDGVEVNGKSIIGVLMLCAAVGSSVTVRTSGIDAEQAADVVGSVVEAIHDY